MGRVIKLIVLVLAVLVGGLAVAEVVEGYTAAGSRKPLQLDSDGKILVGGSAATPSHVNLQQVGGTVTTTGAGAVTAGTLRSTLASDDPAVASLGVLDDWDETDRAKVNPIVGQAGIAAGSGVLDALTPRVTLATNDPAVTALQVMDDWDEGDRAKANLIVGQAGISAGSAAIGATTPSVTLATNDPAVASLAKSPWAKLDDDAAGNCVAITTLSAQFTLPGSAGDWYCMDASGTMAFILCGADPTATLTVTTGYAFKVASGMIKCRRLTGPKCAVIGTAAPAGASICFEHFNPAL